MKSNLHPRHHFLQLILLVFSAIPAVAQERLRLPDLYREVERSDPRFEQGDLQQRGTDLAEQNLDRVYLPKIRFGTEATYQSEVPSFSIPIPGVDAPAAPKERVAATIDLEQLIWDGGTAAEERRVKVSELTVAQRRLDATLFELRREVDEAFYSALLLKKRSDELQLTLLDLDAGLELLRTGLREGIRLPGDTATLRAEILRVQQKVDEIDANRRVALHILGDLTGRNIGEDVELELPDATLLGERVDQIRSALERSKDAFDRSGPLGRHPQYALFEAEHLQLESRGDLLDQGTQPRISAFGQLGVGRPGISQFDPEVHPWWLAGFRLQWSPFDWGRSDREEEMLSVRGEILKTEEDAFSARLRRYLRGDLEAIDRLDRAIRSDGEIIRLREQIERQAERQLEERAITPSTYLDARTDLQNARLQREEHQIELVRSETRLLTTLGLELP